MMWIFVATTKPSYTSDYVARQRLRNFRQPQKIYEPFRFLWLVRRAFRHRSQFSVDESHLKFNFFHITSSQFFSSLHTSADLFSPRLTFSPLATSSQPLPPLRTSAPLFWFLLPALLLNSSHLVSTRFTSFHLFSSLLKPSLISTYFLDCKILLNSFLSLSYLIFSSVLDQYLFATQPLMQRCCFSEKFWQKNKTKICKDKFSSLSQRNIYIHSYFLTRIFWTDKFLRQNYIKLLFCMHWKVKHMARNTVRRFVKPSCLSDLVFWAYLCD